MDDDFDDLLDEVESKFCSGKATGVVNGAESDRNKFGSSLQSPDGNKRSVKKGNPELNDLIDDILTETGDDHIVEKPTQPPPARQQQVSTKKCFNVYLSGSQCPSGLSTSVQAKSCDRLRCTDCDFQVAIYNNYHWHSTLDYLFLRNNMPEFNRVKSKLVHKKGSRAYACQCKWKSVTGDLMELNLHRELKWVCGKHA